MKVSKYLKVAESFIKKQSKDKEVIGVLLVGSLVNGNIGPHSDIDIYIILDDSCSYRERGNKTIEGIEVEYFKNPARQVRQYFKNEADSPHTAHMLATGSVYYEKDRTVKKLVEEAKAIIKEKVSSPSTTEIELHKYCLHDYMNDLYDAKERKDLIAYHRMSKMIVDISIKTLFRVGRKHVPKTNWMSEELEKEDPKFKKLLLKVYQAKTYDTGALENLRKHIEKKIGGKRSKQWKLISKLTPELQKKKK